jgi:hypothetical protein
MQAKVSLQTKRSAEEMRYLLEEQSRSGLIVKEFCKEQRLSAAVFYYWQKKFRRQHAINTVSMGFKEIALNEHSSRVSGDVYAEYKGIRFYQEPSASLLRQLIG